MTAVRLCVSGVTVCAAVAGLLGCAASGGTVKPGFSKQSQETCGLPLIFHATKETYTNDDGAMQIHELGNVLILSSWDYWRTYDTEGTLVEFDDSNNLFPLFNAKRSDKDGVQRASGNVLLFFNYDTKDGNTGAEAPVTTQPGGE